MWLVHNIIIMIDFIDLFPHNCSNTYADIVPLLKKLMDNYSYYTTNYHSTCCYHLDIMVHG